MRKGLIALGLRSIEGRCKGVGPSDSCTYPKGPAAFGNPIPFPSKPRDAPAWYPEARYGNGKKRGGEKGLRGGGGTPQKEVKPDWNELPVHSLTA